MRKYINYIIIFLFGFFLISPVFINAAGNTYQSGWEKKNKECQKLDTRSCEGTSGCTRVGEQCKAKSCSNASANECSELSYCVPRELKRGNVTTAACQEADGCDWYNKYSTNCVSMDDYGTQCDVSKCSTMQGNADIISASYNDTNGGDNIRACSSYLDLMKRGVAPAAGAANDKVCDEYGKKMNAAPWEVNGAVYTCKHTPSYKYYYELSCSNMGKTTCPEGKVAYYQYRVSGSVYICGDPVFGGGSTGGSGGGRRQCRDNFGYVENALTQNCDPDRDDSCEVSACTDVSTEQVGTIDTGAKYGNTGYNFIRYRGTCDGAGYDAFCIDPGISFSSSGYGCQATMNDENAIDKAFAKIYQTSLDKNYYYNDYRSGITSNGKYKALHIAFRLLTAYKRIMHNSNMALAAAFEHSADRYVNISAPLIDPYFMVKVNNKLADDNDENWGSAKDIDFVNGVKIFKAAVVGDPWLNPMKFELRSQWKGQPGAELDVALVNTSGLKQNNLYADESWAQGIYCNGCQILSVPSGNLADINEAIIHVRTTASSFTIGVKYYDRRDRKNMVIATKNQSASYQRLALTNIEAIRVNSNRAFLLEKQFDGSKGCAIIGGKYYNPDGVETTRDGFINSPCCAVMDNDAGLYRSFCDTIPRNSDDYEMMCGSQSNWLKNGCLYKCSPNSSIPKGNNCDEMEGNDVVISDLTNAENMGTQSRYQDSDDYCLSCLTDGSTDLSNTPYSHRHTDYCDIYCIEEYKFNVPKHLGVNGNLKYGRYLTLEVPSTAKKICYTDPKKRIDYDKFVTDISNMRTTLNAEIAELNKRRDAYNEVVNNKGSIQHAGMGVCSESYQDCPDGYWNYPNCASNRVNVCGCSGNDIDPGTGTCRTACYTSPVPKSRPCSNGANPEKYWYTSSNGITKSSEGSCNQCNASNGSADGVINEFKKYRDEQKAKVDGLVRQYNQMIESYNSCFDFGSDSCIGNGSSDPYIEYTYAEDYYMSQLGTNNKLTGSWSTTNTTRKYYEQTDPSKGYCTYVGSSQTGKVETGKIFSRFDADGDTYKRVDNQISVPVNKFVYYTETKNATLKPTTTWYTKIGNGSATLRNEANTTYLGNVLPISRICLDRVERYNYELKFKNIGQYPDSCNMGRLNEVLKNINNTVVDSEGKYVCDYFISNKGCEGCETTYFFRPVSLNDVFPKSGKGIEEASRYDSDYRPDTSVKQAKLTNERGAAPNWTTEKGKQTQKNIENLGDNTYTKEHLEYSYTITPAGMKQIRSYNSDKTYGDFTLTCNDQGDCTSTFLNEIEQNKYSGVKQNKRDPNLERFTDGSIWR